MKKFLRDTFRLLRPRQWVKNLAVFAALIFSGQLFDPYSFQKVFWGFIAFCLLSSAIYIINDIIDIPKDRLHPFKRFRPLANKDLPVSFGLVLAIIIIIITLIIGTNISFDLLFLLLVFLALQMLYSLQLKHIAIIDILTLASGYILRVYAGEIITGYHISVWLLLTVISLSLFLAVGKRRRELTLISGYSTTQIASVRKSLSHYSEHLLDIYASIFVTTGFIFYSLFTFLGGNSQINNDLFLPNYLPAQFQRKWLMLTIIPVIYGLMRYLQVIYEKHEGESPEKVLFSDKQLLTTVIVWLFLVIAIVYGLQRT
ncbi:MAG TPA: decaprenyl-phosphate phosphoribosyltransferase [Patescibacteria group bacterium]|nr:decaprenyl-phosphate phosphoribosyltransferase [Patescibacteria group bacterium]